MFARGIHRFVNNRWRHAWGPALLVGCAAIFVSRGPYRGIRAPALDDLISPYIQADAFVHGSDPYSPQSLLEYWPRGALASRPDVQQFRDGTVLVRHGIPTAYPITCLALISPLTFAPWPVVKISWVVLSTALFFVMVWS